MKKNRRILIEALTPPLLGAIIFEASGTGSDTISDRIFYFPFLVFAAYAFCLIPSLLYALAMELWFWWGLRSRYGLLGTVIFSATLGCGGGAAIEHLIDGYQISSPVLLLIGSLVGLLIGFYVSRQPPPIQLPRTTTVLSTVALAKVDGTACSAVAARVINRRGLSYFRWVF